MEPTQFGNYTLLERISHGGMAEVYRAKSFGEAGFEREVALKLLLPSMASDAEFVNMLIDEAKIAGQLNHANIAQIFDLGVTDGRYYIVQEYVSGQDLRSILQHKADTNSPLDIATACHIALKVCEGLYYAHNKQDASGRPLNLVHRDISPHNILISAEGEVKIIDFGIAKAEGRSTQTMAGLVKGKFAYMSPEQIRGLPVDHRSDVFASGIVLHEMLANCSLFRRSSEFETLKRARSATAEPPSKFNPKVPPALDKIVLKALARHVDDRYQSALEFRDALWAFAREHNTFAERDAFGNPSGGESSASIEIELASAVSKLIEIHRSSGESHYQVQPPTQQPATPQRPKQQHREEEEVEDTTDNATMVDPQFLFQGTMGEDEEATDGGPTESDDDDAQWARDVGGPLSAPSAYAMPARAGSSPTKKLAVLGEEETTSDRSDVPTAADSQDMNFVLDESTAPKFAGVGARSISSSQAPVRTTALRDALDQEARTIEDQERVQAKSEVEEETVKNARVTLGTANTAPVSKRELALAATAALPARDITPLPTTRPERALAKAGGERSGGHASGAQPAAEVSLSRSPQMPPTRPSQPRPGSSPADLPHASVRAQSQPGYPSPSTPPGPPQGYAVPQVAGAYPQAQGYQPAGYPQAPYAEEHAPAPPWQQSAPAPAYPGQVQGPGSGPMPMHPMDPSGAYPYPIADPGSAPYVMPQSSQQLKSLTPLEGLAYAPRRLYLVLTAVFILLLAGAATITLVVTG